jgi:hypothetical protein
MLGLDNPHASIGNRMIGSMRVTPMKFNLFVHPVSSMVVGLSIRPFELHTPSVSKHLSSLTLFYNFDHSKNCASTIYFVCYML